jgi:hypothetical protein
VVYFTITNQGRGNFSCKVCFSKALDLISAIFTMKKKAKALEETLRSLPMLQLLFSFFKFELYGQIQKYYVICKNAVTALVYSCRAKLLELN